MKNEIEPISLHLITKSHNPRKPLKKLQALGFDPMAFCHDFGLSEDSEKQKHFVSVIRENHPEIELMSESVCDRGQIQPITLRPFKNKSEVNYGIACGERRYIACVFRQANSGEPFPVEAVIKKVTEQEAYWMGVEENLIREDMDEFEKGQIFHKYAEDHNCPMTDVAKHFHVEYSYARGRAALVNLKPDRVAAYEAGKINLTNAIKEALGESSKPSRKGTRQNPLTMTAIRALFDATPHHRTERLQALAEVMQTSLKDALVESELRIGDAELGEARQAEREEKRKSA